MMLPTPAVGDANGGRALPADASITGRRADGSKCTVGLQAFARRMMPTPTRNDEKGADYQKGKGDRVYLTLPGAAKLREGVAVQEGLARCVAHASGRKGGKLRPQPVEWMQGWPDGWTLTDGPSLLDAPPPQQERWPDCRWTTSEPEDNRRPRLMACGNGVYGPCGEAVGLDLAASLGMTLEVA